MDNALYYKLLFTKVKLKFNDNFYLLTSLNYILSSE